MANRKVGLNAAQAAGFASRHGGTIVDDGSDDSVRTEDLSSPGSFTRPNPNDIAQTSIRDNAGNSRSGGGAVDEAMAIIGRKAVHAALTALTKASRGPLTSTTTKQSSGSYKTVILDAAGKVVAESYGTDPTATTFLERYGLGKSDDASNVLRKNHSGPAASLRDLFVKKLQAKEEAETNPARKSLLHSIATQLDALPDSELSSLTKSDWDAASAGDLNAIRKMAAATESKWLMAKGFTGRLGTGRPLQKRHSDNSFQARWARKFASVL